MPRRPRRRRDRDRAADRHPRRWRVTDDELAALDALGKEGVWHVGGDELKLTNLDKPLFEPREPDGGGPITKRELIRYFARIAPTMLPHLADRPLNLQRFPNGAGAPGLLAEGHPRDRAEVADAAGTRPASTGGRIATPTTTSSPIASATLCWLGNQASFEIHAWTGRLPDPWQPDLRLHRHRPGREDDLGGDPRPRPALPDRAGAPRRPRLPKTTGKRGIQIWIPIVPNYDFDETSAWVERISRAVGSTVPDLVSLGVGEGRPQGPGPARLHPERDIKTLVAPYAVRPAPGAPVSAPITWDELDDPDLRPDRWTIRTIVERVAERRRPVRGRPDRRPGAPRGLTPRRPQPAWQDSTDDRRHDRARGSPTDDELRRLGRGPPAAAFAEVFSDAEFEHERRTLGDRPADRRRRRRDVGRDRRRFSFRLTVPGGEVGPPGSPSIGVAPEPSAARDPAPDDALAPRPGASSAASRWRSCTPPRARSTSGSGSGSATLQSQFDIERTRVAFLRPARAARPDPAGRARRGRAPLPAGLRRHPCPGAGRGQPERAKWRYDLLDARVAAAPRAEVHRRARGRRRSPRLRDLPGQERMGRPGPNNTLLVLEVTGLDAAAERALWEWLFGIDLVGHIKGRMGPCRIRCCSSWPSRRRLGLNVREGCGCAWSTCRAALEARSYAGPGRSRSR